MSVNHSGKAHSIQTRLALLVVITLSVITFTGFVFVLNQDISRLRELLIEDAHDYGALLSQDFVRVITSGSIDHAADVTDRLRSLHKIQGVTVFNQQQIPVFSYTKNNAQHLPDFGQFQMHEPVFFNGSLSIYLPVNYQGKDYGYLQLLVSTQEMKQAQASYISQAIVVVLALFASAFLLVYLIQRYFSRPVQQLATALRYISQTQDFTRRLPVTRNDEIGELFEGFNTMSEKVLMANQAQHEKEYALDQHAIVVMTDPDGHILYTNSLFTDVSGYRTSELLGKNIRMLNSGIHDRAFFHAMYSVISNGEVWQGEICNRDRHGEIYWVDTTIVPLVDEKETPHSYISIGTDISEHKRVEAALRESENKYSTLFEKSADAILLLEDGKFIDCNKAALDMLGYPDKQSLLETHPAELSPEQQPDGKYSFEKANEMIALAYARGSYRFEWMHTRKNGEVFPVEVLLTAIPIKDKTVLHVVWRDITERQQTEQALRRAQKMDAIGELSGGIAHDFNNILGIILGNLDLLEKQIDVDEKAGKRIDGIRYSAMRAVDLTRQLLGFSRREETRVIVTNINQLIGNMDEMIARSLTPQIETGYQLDEKLMQCEIAPGDFEDALINLVINARDAMNGRGKLTIETRNTRLDEEYCRFNPGAIPGQYVELAISDTGEGMTQEVQERIFEPFFTTKAQGKGTGLGMAMVFGFVKRSGGTIKVYSEKGVGTTIRIYLPCSCEVAELEAETVEDINHTTGGQETILVVDDEAELLELVEDSLSSLGYRVLTASCGQQALDTFQQVPEIDMLFSDVVMPGSINGFELAEKLAEEKPALKILLTSGYTEKAIAQNGQSRFKLNMLAKPYTQAALAQKIRELLNEKSDDEK